MSKIVLANLDDVNSLKEEKANKTDLAKTDRSLDLLWKLNKGQTYDFESVTSVANPVDVPSGAMMGSIEMLGGKSVVVNQLAREISSNDWVNYYSFNTSISFENGMFTVTYKSDGLGYGFGVRQRVHSIIPIGHKVIFFTDLFVSETMKFGVELNSSYSFLNGSKDIIGGEWIRTSTGVVSLERDWTEMLYSPRGGKTGTTYSAKNARLYDLTAMFGSGNEPTDVSDPRIAWIERYVEAHPEYNEGTIVSAEYDVIESKDAEGNVIAEKTLPALPTLYGINDDVYDYIDFEPVTYKNMKSVDLGSLEWSRRSTGIFEAHLTDVKRTATADEIANVLCGKYYPTSSKDMATKNGGISVLNGTDYIWIMDSSFADAQSFKTAMQGIILHYEATEGGTDYNAKLLHKKCGSVDLALLTWTYSTGGGFWVSSESLSGLKYPKDNFSVINGMSDKYLITYYNICGSNNNSVCANVSGKCGVNTGSSTDKPVGTLIYELATEQILDVTDILADFDNTIEVEAHGTLTFKNTEDDSVKIPIPNTMEYCVKLSEV